MVTSRKDIFSLGVDTSFKIGKRLGSSPNRSKEELGSTDRVLTEEVEGTKEELEVVVVLELGFITLGETRMGRFEVEASRLDKETFTFKLVQVKDMTNGKGIFWSQ